MNNLAKANKFSSSTTTSKKYGNIQKEIIDDVISDLFTGTGYTSNTEKKIMQGKKPVAKKLYYSASSHISQALENVVSSTFMTDLTSRNTIVLCGDGGWSIKRQSYSGSYACIDFATGKIVMQHTMVKQRALTKANGKQSSIVEEGNWDKTSKSMEIGGFLECINALEKTGILAKVHFFVCDRDTGMAKQFATNKLLQHVQILYDIGHVKKAAFGEAVKIFRTRQR